MNTAHPPFRRLLTLLAFCLASMSSIAWSGGTRNHYLDDFEDFDDGEVQGAAIESSGTVTVGFLSKRTDAPGTGAFTCLATKDAAVVGTSDPATLQRVRIDGKTGSPKLNKLAELPGVVVTAVAELPGGDLLAASIPGGKIHRVSQAGKTSVFAELDVEQIWGIRLHRDRVLVATGPDGELFSLNRQGKDEKVVLDVEPDHLLSLITIGDRVLVGTAPDAKLFEVTDELEGTLLQDFEGDELRALATTEHGLVAVVNEFEQRKLTSLEALKKQLNRASLVGQPSSGASAGGRPPKADARVQFLDLGPDMDVDRISEASWEQWLERKRQYFTGLLTLADRKTVLVSSSDSGKVYRLKGMRDTATIADLEERQALSLCQLQRGTVLATSGDGSGVYALASAPARKARYRTEVLDAGHPAEYGALHLRGVGPLVVRARSGPSDEPDERWSKWKRISLASGMDGFRGSLGAVPNRRYLQIEVRLAGPAATLRDLRAFYGPENLAPLVSDIEVTTPSFDLDDDEEPDREVTIKWDADARDGDDLSFEVRVRPEGGSAREWFRVDDANQILSKERLKWDVTSVPNGAYEVEVRATDAPSNGTARARTDELVSAPVVVDHERPEIMEARAEGLVIRGKAGDRIGYVHDVAFSIDGGPFRPASATDGLFDGPSEAFEVTLPDTLSPGQHRLVLRARDAFGNLTTTALIIER